MNMEPVSAAVSERSRKYQSLVLSRLASVGQRAVADQIGVHESTISRMKEGEIERFCKVLEALDLKVVSREMKCFNPKDIETILHQAKRWMSHVESVEQLWDDE